MTDPGETTHARLRRPARGGLPARRATAAGAPRRVGRAVVADALRPVDPAGALAAEQETTWRAGYLAHFRRLVEAGLGSREAALTIAAAGLAVAARRHAGRVTAGRRARWPRWSDGATPGPAPPRWSGRASRRPSCRCRTAATGCAATRCDAGSTPGSPPGSSSRPCADAVGAVLRHPEWLRLEGRTVAVLGAGAEMGPLAAAAALGRPGRRRRPAPAGDLEAGARRRRTGGPARCCCRRSGGGAEPDPTAAGVDLLADAAGRRRLARRARRGHRWSLGNYVYADGATNVRVSTAVDALTRPAARERARHRPWRSWPRPTDVFAVPAEAVEHSTRRVRRPLRGRPSSLGRPLRTLSAAAACCAARTSPGPTRGSTTAWSRSRAPTTRWPSGCSGGGRPSPGTTAPRCR